MANITGSLPGESAIVGTLSTTGTMSGSLGTVYGKDGKSAYEIAVKYGFEGTEEEWLASLPGEDGKDGVDGTVSFDELTEAQRESLRGEQGEQGPQGEKGPPGVVKFVVVTTLPAEDTENAIYLVPSTESTEANMYDEYIYVDGEWEKIGSTGVDVDLADYVKNTDIANNKVGLVKIGQYGTHGININADTGLLSLAQATEENIDNKVSYKPIVPANLDYAIKKGLADNKLEWTDDEKTAARELLGVTNAKIATYSEIGLVKPSSWYGIIIDTNGTIQLVDMKEAHINSREGTAQRVAVTTAMLDYAVKKAMTDPKNTTWTEEEKAAARTLLGVNIEDGDEVSY